MRPDLTWVGVFAVAFGATCLWTRRRRDENQLADWVYRAYRWTNGDSVDDALLVNGAVGLVAGVAMVIFG
jgi:hypothetical protein